jgi:hypothetical protein
MTKWVGIKSFLLPSDRYSQFFADRHPGSDKRLKFEKMSEIIWYLGIRAKTSNEGDIMDLAEICHGIIEIGKVHFGPSFQPCARVFKSNLGIFINRTETAGRIKGSKGRWPKILTNSVIFLKLQKMGQLIHRQSEIRPSFVWYCALISQKEQFCERLCAWRSSLLRIS